MRPKSFHSVLLFVLCLAFFGGSAMAQSIIVNDQMKSKKNAVYRSNIDQTKYDKRTLSNGIELYNPKSDKAPQREFGEADMVTVTCKIEGDETLYDPLKVWVYNNDFSRYFYPSHSAENDPTTVICHVPVGIYDLRTEATPMNDGNMDTGFIFSVKELVNIQHDTTLVFDLAESNHKYEFRYYKQDGVQANLPVVQFNEDWSQIIDTISQGNINALFYCQNLILKDYGTTVLIIGLAETESFGNNRNGTIFLNDLSDRYMIGSVFTFEDDENGYLVKFETSDLSKTIIENNPNDYVLYQEKFTPSLTNSFDGEGMIEYHIVNMLDWKSQTTAMSTPYRMTKNRTIALYVDAPKSTRENNKYDVMIAPAFVDQIVSHTETLGYFDEDGNFVTYIDEYFTQEPIVGLPVLFNSDGSFEYVNANHDQGGNIAFHFTDPATGNDLMEYPGHPQFSYFSNQKALEYGSSCPINAFMAQNTPEGLWTEGKYMYLNCCYIGRYGEVRTMDLYNLQTEIRYNDEIICDNHEMIANDLYNFAVQGYPDGEITAHFVNSNMMVDGLRGMNMTDVYFDQRQDDWTAPTLQMLLFKDLEGNIIDRFESADEGILEFAGGDFNYHLDVNTYYYWFDCKPQTVEVSYSPYSADDWASLEVNEIPEEFYMPGFGYFYRGLLKDVTGRGEKGWFDLKIKLTDLSGNWQEQVISPAFRIGNGSQTGIEAIKSDTATEVARYTIDGRSLSAPQTGVNIVKMSNGTVKKVLVK